MSPSRAGNSELGATTLPSPGRFGDDERFVTLKSSGAGQVFRGVAFAPMGRDPG